MQKWGMAKGLDDAAIQNMLAPHYGLIDDIYIRDMPFAQTIAHSDLVIRAKGRTVREHRTHLNVVDGLFNITRQQVHRLSKAIAGISDVLQPMPKDVDLLLTGTAPGSFIFGVALPSQEAFSKQVSHIKAKDDPLYCAVKESFEKLSAVPLFINGHLDEGLMRETIPDPGVRDALISVAAEMSPTGRKGVDEVLLYDKKSNYETVKPFTPITRRMFKDRIKQPLEQTQKGKFIGTVREIDLDVDRFEIRGVKNVGGIRCIAKRLSNTKLSALLGSQIEVSGSYVTNAAGQPRLMEVDDIKPVITAHQKKLL